MQSMNTQWIDELIDKMDSLIKEMPELRREAHERIGKRMEAEIDAEIARSAGKRTGKMEEWQENYVGSKGGYAAVRAKAETFEETKEGTKYAVGYITNAYVSGHAIRPHKKKWKAKPDGTPRKYVSKAKKRYVLGSKVYEKVRPKADRIALEELNRFADEVEKRLKP